MQHTDEQILELIKNDMKGSKNSKQLTDLIKILFSQPQILIHKFKESNSKQVKPDPKQQHHKSHNVDLNLLIKFYQRVKQQSKSQQLALCLQKTFNRFQTQGELKKFYAGNHGMKYFYIILFWQGLFADKKLLFRYVNLLAHSGGYVSYLSEWMNDIKSDYFVFIVNSLQEEFVSQSQKFKGGDIDPSLLKYCDQNVRNICLFMQLMYKSNKVVNRAPQQIFINNKITQLYDPIQQFGLQLKKIANHNILQFSFLLPLDYKYKMLQIESIFQQKQSLKSALQYGLPGLLMGLGENEGGDLSLQGLVYLHFKINRHNILDDSMEKLGKTTKNLKSQMRIQFIGEEGSDEGGVKNQYFQLLIKEIFNPHLDMFRAKNHNRVYWFNGFSFEAPIRFEFVGMLLGLAIYNLVLLDIKFPPVLYRKLLDKQDKHQDLSPQVLNDLFQIEPQIAAGLKKLLTTTEPLDDLLLSFNIEFDHFGQKIIEELVDDGNLIRVTQDNKNEYVMLYADYLLNKHSLKQFVSFKKGFLRVVSGDMINVTHKIIQLLSGQELEKIICGSPNIDFKELQSTAAYEGGYSKQTPVIKQIIQIFRNLWNILHSFNLQEKKAFLIFLTGTDRVPIEGLKALNMVIQKHSANTDHLPTAHTCFNVLLLPEYQTKYKLQQKLRLILKHNQGFGLI